MHDHVGQVCHGLIKCYGIPVRACTHSAYSGNLLQEISYSEFLHIYAVESLNKGHLGRPFCPLYGDFPFWKIQNVLKLSHMK